MKTLSSIFISIIIYVLCIYLISGLGTQIYVNNINSLDQTDINKLTKISVEVDYIQNKLNLFENSTTEFQQTDVSLVKEYIAEFLDSRTTIQQFVDFIKQAYRGGDILIMAFPYAIYGILGDFFLQIYRIFFIMTITLGLFIAIKGGNV